MFAIVQVTPLGAREHAMFPLGSRKLTGAVGRAVGPWTCSVDDGDGAASPDEPAPLARRPTTSTSSTTTRTASTAIQVRTVRCVAIVCAASRHVRAPQPASAGRPHSRVAGLCRDSITSPVRDMPVALVEQPQRPDQGSRHRTGPEVRVRLSS